MVEEWGEADMFGELRSVLGGAPSAEAFRRVCGIVEAAELCEPGVFEARWRDYALGALRRWPAELCAVSIERAEDLDEVLRSPWHELVRGVDVGKECGIAWDDSVWWSSFLELEHLKLPYGTLSLQEIERAGVTGVFEGLTSLDVGANALSLKALERLMEALGEAGSVRRLVLSSCALGARHVEVLCGAPWVFLLEELDLSYNGVRREGLATLAASAPRFEALRVLHLGFMDISGKSAAALAGAAWSETLERILFTGAAIKSAGLAGFVDAGRLGWLVSRERGRSRLDLFDQGIRNPGVAALAGCEALAEVDEVSLYNNPVSSIAPLVTSPFVEGIRRWDFGCTSLGEGSAEDLLELVRRTRPRTLRVVDLPLDDAFLTALLAMEEACELEVFDIWCPRPRYGLIGLEAWLDWPRSSEVDLFFGAFRVPRDAPAVARAMATGRFTTEDANPYTGEVTVVHRTRGKRV